RDTLAVGDATPAHRDGTSATAGEGEAGRYNSSANADDSPANADSPEDQEAVQVRFIQERFTIPEIIVTKGAAGAAYYTPAGNWQVPGTPVKVADTIGSGDAFLAAFLVSHARKDPPPVTLQKAAAMGAFIAGKK